MASPKIKIKRTAVAGKVPTTSQLDLGELAINTTDGKLFLKKFYNNIESIVDVGAATTLAGNNGEFQFNDNGSYGASPNLTYDGLNITATDLKLVGTLTANGSTGASGYVLASTGSGVQWIQMPGLQLFPTGDYNAGADPTDPLTDTIDPFGVSTIPSWDNMEPEGTLLLVDLGTV